MILVIDICREYLHFFEFVQPIIDILEINNIRYQVKPYTKLLKKDFNDAERIIICGTSLIDNGFLNNIERFFWLKDFNKPVLGICGGMHILGVMYNGFLKKTQEIGFEKIDFKKDFLGFIGEKQVYELHNFFVESNQFNVFAKSKNCIQAIKHKHKPFFGVLFHPEVRNKDLICNFALFSF